MELHISITGEVNQETMDAIIKNAHKVAEILQANMSVREYGSFFTPSEARDWVKDIPKRYYGSFFTPSEARAWVKNNIPESADKEDQKSEELFDTFTEGYELGFSRGWEAYKERETVEHNEYMAYLGSTGDTGYVQYLEEHAPELRKAIEEDFHKRGGK